MQELKASRLSQTEAVSLKQIAAGAPHSSISSDHFGHFRKLMLIERHGSAWKLTPLGAPPTARHAQGRADNVCRSARTVGEHGIQAACTAAAPRTCARTSGGSIEHATLVTNEDDAMAARNVSLDGAHAVPPELSQAIARICEAEGVTLAQVRSMQIDENEIGIRIERQGGGSRIVTYPLAILVAQSAARPGNALKTDPQKTDLR